MIEIQTSADNTTAESKGEYVAFRIGSQEFCINILSIREIRGWTQETALPHVPSFVRGVINLRGSIVPIVDLAARLGLLKLDPTTRNVIVIVQIDRQIVGLLVDAVSDILRTEGLKFQATPDVASEVAKSFVTGVLAMEGRMISKIALEAVFPVQDKLAA